MGRQIPDVEFLLVDGFVGHGLGLRTNSKKLQSK